LITKKSVTVRIDDDVLSRVDNLSKTKRLTRSALINIILAEYTENIKQPLVATPVSNTATPVVEVSNNESEWS
jgi:antitoxin component of RelBE/YafQ-DinJ toxin-antitoxin module